MYRIYEHCQSIFAVSHFLSSLFYTSAFEEWFHSSHIINNLNYFYTLILIILSLCLQLSYRCVVSHRHHHFQCWKQLQYFFSDFQKTIYPITSFMEFISQNFWPLHNIEFFLSVSNKLYKKIVRVSLPEPMAQNSVSSLSRRDSPLALQGRLNVF